MIEFVEVGDNVTKVTSTTSYSTPEELQEVLDMGMEDGMSQSWDKLVSLVETK